MYHLKKFANSPAIKQELTASISKILPVTATFSRNYADHQIPDRLKDVPNAKGLFHACDSTKFRTIDCAQWPPTPKKKQQLKTDSHRAFASLQTNFFFFRSTFF